MKNSIIISSIILSCIICACNSEEIKLNIDKDLHNGFYELSDDNNESTWAYNDTNIYRIKSKPSLNFNGIIKITKSYNKRINDTSYFFTLNKESSLKFKELTENNIGKVIPFYYNDKLLSATNLS